MPRRKKIEIELEGLPKLLGAEVYAEASHFVCLMPLDAKGSVIGRGDSVADAINAWDVNLKGHLRNAGDDDPIVKYVKGLLGGTPSTEEVSSVIKGPIKVAIKKTREQNMAEFEAQFIPPNRYLR
jgi:hypothetical protein